ncbi:MAG: mechanosensitive ion channel family protein [candidate division Zixibacteria bacterium]|nr:mechanosensitive ion channel family protein [candidate division Zixibacteria bacterium]
MPDSVNLPQQVTERVADTLSQAQPTFLSSYNLPIWAEETIISLLIIIGAIVVSFLAVLILSLVRKHIAGRTETDLDDKIIDAVKRPLHMIMILAGLVVAAQRLEGRFPEAKAWIFKTTDQVVVAVILVVIAFFLLKLVRIITEWYAQKDKDTREQSLAQEFAPLINRVVKILILVLMALMVLEHFGQDVTGLVAVLGVGSLAIALAAQDTVANTIAGFIIMMDRPFRRGDRVILPSGDKVDVYEIGLRSTKFMTFDHTLIVVPNQELVKSTMVNLSYPYEEIRVRVDVGVAYGSNLDEVKAILVDVAEKHPTVLKSYKPKAYLMDFGDSSLDFSLRCRVAKISEQWRTTEQLRCTIYDRLNEASIEIPFPQRVVYLQRDSSDENSSASDKQGQGNI